MKLLIFGGRDFPSYPALATEITNRFPPLSKITLIIHGDCKSGADRLGDEFAKTHGIPVETYPADWKKHGRSAGPIRNKTMAAICDEAIGFWDSKSRGTAHMINELRAAKKPCTIIPY